VAKEDLSIHNSMENLMKIARSVTYIASAASLLFSSPLFAQSSVTLFGVADAYVGSIKNGSLRNTVVNSSALNSTRWGLRGVEDLGGGLKASFVLESGVNIDNGTSASGGALFSRQAYVGLGGGFGEVRMGRQYSAYDEIRGGTNNTSDSSLFASTSGAWAAGGDYTNRINNQLYYTSPNFGGVTAAVGYGFGEDKTATLSASSTLSLNVKYANGPFTIAFAHQKEDPVGSTPVATKYNMLAGSVDLKFVKFVGGYNQASGPDKEKEYQVGVEAPFGAARVFAGYANSKAKSNAGATTEKGRAFSLLATYDLSKRTALYAGINDTERKNAAGVKTADTQTFGVGVRHRF
jgi:predicted porin